MITGSRQRRSSGLRRQLLRGASALAITTALGLPHASAGQLAVLRGAASIANAAITAKAPQPGASTSKAGAQNAANSQGMASASLRSLQYQAHVSSAQDLATQAQQAAQQAAAALEANVPNGLGLGGLDPVSNPVSAANDTNGLHTWQGASLPTQTTTSSGVNVTVHQTQSRAILSWQTFNVGQKTTLTFDQSQNGKAQTGWVALNRVVGQLDPNTGLRDAGATPLPSEILGTIKAPGTVLILNQNGVIFGGTSQINVDSLIATSLEIGRAFDPLLKQPLSIKDRNDEFLTYGLLGFADQASTSEANSAFTFSAQEYVDSNGVVQTDPLLEGTINVNAGAQITSADSGFILLAAPKIVNSGTLTSPLGEVALQAGRDIQLFTSTGAADSTTPDVRGFTAQSEDSTPGEYVENTTNAIIDAPQGYVSLGATQFGAVIDQGVLESTTSVSRNGFIQLTGGDIQLSPGSTLAITPDDSAETIPQDPTSLEDFKASRISIGSDSSRIEIGSNAMIYAPGANVDIGAAPGAASTDDSLAPGTSRIFIDTGAVIDVAGLTDVLIPASRNSVEISPVKGNELANDPNYKDSFLNGATVFVDPRLSGVRADGVEWVGSPLIDAASYAEQVGISVKELMTKGGNVTLGVKSYAPGTDVTQAPDVTVKSGAVIDISGGWVTYQAGFVQTTQLIDSAGEIIDISNASPDGDYIGIYEGFTQVQPRWGVVQSWASPLLMGTYYEPQYTEGRDAGSLTLKGSTIVLDGTVYGNAYAGARQIADGQVGTAKSSIYGDNRALQGAPSQLPSGGFLFIQGLGQPSGTGGALTGAGDISVVSQANYVPVSSSLTYGQSVYVDSSGNLVQPTRDPSSLLPTTRQDTISLSADALSNMGLSQLSLQTSGAITIASDATVNLAAGGVFDAVAGRTITVDGKVSVPSGTIQLQTINAGVSSVFLPTDPVLGSYDIVVNGTLSTRGQWINDFGSAPGTASGDYYTNGGSITLIGAPDQTEFPSEATVKDSQKGNAPTTNIDISGSILLNQGSVVDVSGGGYVSPNGTFDLSAHGGNLNLIEQTVYFQLTDDPSLFPGSLPGFRVTTISNGGTPIVPVNPSQINARVTLDGTILADGFAGGGTFNLTTPQITFGDGTAQTGTELPLDFFSKSGFANFDITSYKTELDPNTFNNGLGGYNAVLATQVLTVGAGQTLLLSQSMFSPVLDSNESQALLNLGSGGDLYSVLTPVVPTDAWDQRAVNLTLGGLIELDVAPGGSIVGAAGGKLTVPQLYNEGTIDIPGGTIAQSEVLPSLYTTSTTLALNSLSQAFSTQPDGTINEKDKSLANPKLTNAELAATYSFYLLGNLGQHDGIVLAPGSVTDLAGESIVNPRATSPSPTPGPVRTGRIIDGGTIQTESAALTNAALFNVPLGLSIFASENPTGVIAADYLTANPGALVNLSGAADTFDEPGTNGQLTPTPVWSNGGTLNLGNGGTITGATITAQGGAPHAMGGTLIALDPTLTQTDPTTPELNVISAQQIEDAGFDTFVAEGSLSSAGNVTLQLGRGFFLVSRSYGGEQDLNDAQARDTFAPVVSTGGTLEIDAPYISFASSLQNVSTPLVGTQGTGTAIFKADQIDISGAVLFDQSVSDVQLDATGDLRLTGVEPWQQIFNVNPTSVPNSLSGQLAVNGNLEITAAQVYPTTGSTFSITSSAADGTITFARSGTTTPATPYSAGGNLTIQAANIVQGGVIRVPIGSLTIGSNNPFQITTDGSATTFAPATSSVVATPDSITSVSASGLSIPYGTTTDQTEWFFAPTGSSELTAPPQAILTIGGNAVSLQSGATVDVSGGGDLYAYEFIAGTGGSHDVLSQTNNDPFSSANGFQYPDGRQVYAIVPGVSNAEAAAYDPIYSSGYNNLYSAQGAGQQVYLSAVPGLAAGWYTLLPAQYALLPGGMRIVENTGASNVVPGSVGDQRDGSYVVSGYYGTAGTNDYQSTVRSFTVESQSVVREYSDIALTSANQKFAADAAHNGQVAPRLPIDAGRLVLAPAETIAIDTTLTTAAGQGGRGAEVDISGKAFDIVSALPDDTANDGTIYLTADSLTNLNASSLLIGGVRTDNADGTTTLDVTADSIVVQNDSAHPLTGPETILAVDGAGSSITLADGATILATGTEDDPRSGDYIINGSTPGMTGQGALLRVSVGPQRLVTRTNVDQNDAAGILSIGAADLKGNSLLLDSSGDLTASPDASLQAKLLALGAGKVTFTADGAGLSGLVITPALQALFSQAQQLTIRTPSTIDFSSGTYDFNNLTLDTPGLLLRDGDSVVVKAGTLDLANSGTAAAACGAEGAAGCGSGDLTIDASEIDFGSGTLRTYGFGHSVTLAGSTGIFAQAAGAIFDAGPAALNLQTPFLGDRAVALTAGESAAIPSLSFLSTGNVAVSNPGGSTAGGIAGTPGASLSITGNDVSISGTTVRATAGLLDITSSTGISVTDGATLETPGYSHNFGDSADPYIVSAPGGQLELTALDGDIDLASGTTLSIGGATGKAGTLELQAQQGSVSFGGTLVAAAPGGGGSFILDEKGAFDLSDFLTQFAGQFDGTIGIRTATGDLDLAQGETLKAANVTLVADGGLVDIGGTVDVSGVNGGDVSLYGLNGVTLESGSHIDAHANGYGPTDTRQAHGGNVTIGTDGNGTINVDNGAIIDVSARNPGDRLVPMTRNGTVYYTYVQGDVGGTVHFRAPVIQQADGSDTVNVFYNGTIDGASSVILEGFKQFDLAKIAADSKFVGVTINDQGQAVLNVGAVAGDGQFNFLADNADGTLVQFVQDFDISSANSHLGSLASSAVFHEQPGMELDYSGDIVLSSNWNLGAGTVNVAGAVAAGLMAELPTVTGKYYVLPGMEGEVFQRFTNLTYRTGGSVDGEPGILTIRAGGTLDIEGSITDGFFQFHNQNDPDYLNMALGGGDKLYTPYLVTGCIGSCDTIDNWSTGSALPGSYVLIRIPSSDSLGALLDNPAPYNAAANSPAAVGSLAGNSGDPLGSAELFPLLTNPDGSTRSVASWSYQLVGGADLTGSSGGTPSADPLRILAGATGNLVVAGGQNYSYAASSAGASSTFGDGLLFNVGGQYVTANAWYNDFVNANAGVEANSYAFINFQSAPKDVVSFLMNAISSLPADQYQIITSGKTVAGVAMSLKLASQFMTDVVAANFSTLKSDYKAPKPKIETKPTNGFTQTLVRTGTGNIQLAAAGNIDMTGGPVVDRDVYGNVVTKNGLQVGGTAVYTAGHLVDPEPILVTDALTGLTATIDPTPFETSNDFLSVPPTSGYMYGAGGDPTSSGTGLADVYVANPVYAEGGGNVSMNAGGSVLGRRDIWLEARLASFYRGLNSFGYTWIGTGDQPWRSGQIGNASNVGIDPQLFQEGVGALGGGDISITAGGDVSDLSIVDTTSLTTANVQLAGAKPTLALWTFGGGNVDVSAAGNLLGGRLDVASGTANIDVGGNIASAGLIKTDTAGDTQQNELRVRLSDAFVSLAARGSIDIQGIAALGVGGRPDQADINLDSHGFYSAAAGVSLLADGPVTVDNTGSDVLTEKDYTTDLTSSAVYPGTFEAVSLNSDLSVVTDPDLGAAGVILYPSPTGELVLAAGGNILPMTIAEDDGDPGLLPGIFSIFDADPSSGVLSGRTFLFPGVLPNTSEVEREALHNSSPTHLGDPVPNRIYAGGDIENMIVSVAKQTRVGAGLDIVNMMFFGQNLSPSDITRIVAGRDITATTELVEPVTGINPEEFGNPEAAVQGNTFVIGGPGSFFLEAGRDAGPFLNSAVTDGFATDAQNDVHTGTLTYAGGIVSVGNDWNPWLPENGANLFVEFGVGKGQNFDGFRDYYLDPANLPNLNGALFVQVPDANGNLVPDRSQPIYGPILIGWMQKNAAAALVTAYGTTNVSFQQAYDVFKTLPELQQRVFMLGNVYFNELIQTSIPTSPSYKQYSRGYLAVNTLFPASYGYTQNDLSGGGNGSNKPVETGNLDLRLATIQTDHGGNIYILGPGGRVLAGSTVRTSDQAARRTYNGGILFAGNVANAPLPATITAIPIGYEGILTLRGGSIDTFTDEDFLLNQSRLFTEDGGNIAMWSSNGDLNAGQGPKTSANFPPVIVRVDEDLNSQLDSVSGVSGAGIAAFEPAPGVAAPNVYLIAPRGTVDAGDAGVRVAGDLFIAALAVANAENFSVSGTSFGVPGTAAVNVAAQTSGSASAAAAEQAAQSFAAAKSAQNAPSIISVDFLGVIDETPTGDDEQRKRKKQPQA